MNVRLMSVVTTPPVLMMLTSTPVTVSLAILDLSVRLTSMSVTPGHVFMPQLVWMLSMTIIVLVSGKVAFH